MTQSTHNRVLAADTSNAATMIRETPQMTFWEKAAATTWGRYITEVEKRAIMRGQSLAGKPTRALEIGCEGGRWSKLLSDLGWEMTCTDLNPDVLNECHRKVPNANCILANATDRTIPCDSGSLSLLLCIEVAPVIESEWFVSEAARVLRDDGVLVGVACNKMSGRGLFIRARYKALGSKSGEFYQSSYHTFKRKLRRAYFNIVYEEGFCWGPFGRTSNSPLIPFFTRLERLLRLNRLITVSPWIAFIARKAPPRGN
jgi:SAM-dependent methyltransferase